jgi:hypothetical protein
MLRLLALLFALIALAACGGQGPASSPNTQPAQITTVNVELLESSPVQVVAHIQGELGNGCMSLGSITQRRDGNVVEVTVPAIHSGAEACTMQMQLIDQRVQLDGPFAPGDYTVRVNGVEATFSV